MEIQQRNFSWWIIPVLSVILSLPTLLSCLAFGALVCYEVIIKDIKGALLLSILKMFRPPLAAPVVLFMVFGPLFACVLCTLQLTRMQRENTPGGLVGGEVAHLTRATLLVAVVTSVLLVLTAGFAFLLRGPT